MKITPLIKNKPWKAFNFSAKVIVVLEVLGGRSEMIKNGIRNIEWKVQHL